MADNKNYFEQNQNIYTGISDNEKLAQRTAEEREVTRGSRPGPYMTANAGIFANYFKERHNADGHLYTADMDMLTTTQRYELDWYTARRAREEGMRQAGVSDVEIALYRKWDEDMTAAETSGKQLPLDAILSSDYADKAYETFKYDESMYERYVHTGRVLSQEEYDPDGDGHFNLAENLINEFKTYNDNDLAEVYDNMSADQKRLLSFDSVPNRSEFVKYVRKLSAEHEAASQQGGIGQFFKSIAHGFVAGVSELLALPTTLLSIGAGALGYVTGQGWDNAISKWAAGATKSIEESVSGGFDEVIDYKKSDSIADKIGGWTGAGLEIALEAITGAGIAKLGAKATTKVAEKAAAKALVAGASEKVVARAERWSAKALENAVVQQARKTGVRKVDEKFLMSVARNAGMKVESAEAIKLFEHVIEGAANRLYKRGMFKASEEALVKYGAKAAEKAAVKGAEKVAKKEAAKIAEKETAKEVAEKSTEGVLARRAAAKAAEKEFIEFKVAKFWGKNTSEELAIKMMKKPGTVIGRTFNRIYGKTDPLTRLFSIKAFASTVEQARKRGDSPIRALTRGLLAFGSTNFIWGKLHANPGGPIDKMFGTARTAMNKKIQNEVASKSLSFMIANGSRVLGVASRMITDGFVKDWIMEGMRKGEDGSLNWGLKEAWKHTFTWDAVGEAFLSALTMEVTGGLPRGVTSAMRKGIKATPMVRESDYRKTMAFINQELSSEKAGLGAQVWDAYKKEAQKLLGESATEAEIVDAAFAVALAQGGAVGDFAQMVYIKARAQSFGTKLRKNADLLENEMKLTVKEIMDGARKSIEELTGRNDQTITDADREFLLFVENAAMNNANVFEGETVPSTEGLNNYQPDDFFVAYALFKQSGADMKDLNNETVDAIKKAFKRASSVKKTLGEEAYKTLLLRNKAQVAKIIELMTDATSSKDLVKHIKFQAELTRILSKPYATEAARDKAVDALIKRHDIKMEEVKTLEAKGEAESQKVQPILDKSLDRKAENIKKAVIEESMDGYVQTFVKNGEVEPKEVFDSLKELYDNKKLTEIEYLGAVHQAYKTMVKFEKDLPKNPEFKEFTLIHDLFELKKTYNDRVREINREINRLSKETPATGSFDATQTQMIEGYEKELRSLYDQIQKIMSKVNGEMFEDTWRKIFRKAYNAEELTDKIDKLVGFISTTRLSRTPKEQNVAESLSYQAATLDAIQKMRSEVAQLNAANEKNKELVARLEALEKQKNVTQEELEEVKKQVEAVKTVEQLVQDTSLVGNMEEKENAPEPDADLIEETPAKTEPEATTVPQPEVETEAEAEVVVEEKAEEAPAPKTEEEVTEEELKLLEQMLEESVDDEFGC